jgi:chaperonin GroEL
MYSEGCKAVAAGMNPMDLRKGVQMAVDQVVADLALMSQPTDNTDKIRDVATISANGDKEVGGLIADAMAQVGKEGVITVQDGKTLNHELEHTEGMKFDRGYISPYFMTNPKTQKAEYDDAYVMLCSKKISSLSSIQNLLEEVNKSGKPLIIIAEDIESEALATLIVNRMRGVLKISAAKAPGFGDNRKAMLQDMAVLTGGELISDDLGIKSKHRFS